MLEQYVRAWESTDIAGLAALLRDDAVVSMLPGISIHGREAIGAFLASSVFVPGLRVRANGGPAYVFNSGSDADAGLRPYAILLVEQDESRITRISVFADPRLVARVVGPERPAN